MIAAKVRAMFNQANVPKRERYRLFSECTMTATKLDWLIVIEINGIKKTRIEHYTNKGLPGYARYLRTFGEAGTV